MDPLSVLPPIPSQHAFMRVETHYCALLEFMTHEEQLAIRTRIFQWNISHEPDEARKRAGEVRRLQCLGR